MHTSSLRGMLLLAHTNAAGKAMLAGLSQQEFLAPYPPCHPYVARQRHDPGWPCTGTWPR
jgi:DNA-binding IclR family transcriptional regulator